MPEQFPAGGRSFGTSNLLKTLGRTVEALRNTMTETGENQQSFMRPFRKRHRVAEAWEWIARTARPLETEVVALLEAFGRVLATDIVSPVSVPGFLRAMMDGYAVRAEDTLGASPQSPIFLELVGESRPGITPEVVLQSGEAVRIATGAPVPAGADAVLPAEWAEERGNTVIVLGSVSPQKHLAQVGEDIREGEVILRAGRQLRPQDLGLLSSVGIQQVPVIRSPKVRILICGDEILPPGTASTGFRIPDSNGPMLTALVLRDGGKVLDYQILPDDRRTIREALLQPADVILVSGGSSVGHRDLVPEILAEVGEVSIHGLAMRPSSPAGMGRIGSKLVFLLPGNPVSCLCAYDFFAGRAIRLMGGRSSDWPYRRIRATVRRKITSALGRLDYVRVKLVEDQVEPIAVSGAAILSSTTKADGFLLCPEEVEGFAPGTEVEVFLYD